MTPTCPLCHQPTLYVWCDKDSLDDDDDERGGPSTVVRMVKCRNTNVNCGFTSDQPRHVLAIQKWLSEERESSARNEAKGTLVSLKPSPLTNPNVADRKRKRVMVQINKVMECVRQVCILAEVDFCADGATEYYRYIHENYAVPKPNIAYAVVTSIFFAWMKATRKNDVDCSVSMKIGKAADDVFECPPNTSSIKIPYCLRENAKKHINKYLGVLRTCPELGTGISAAPIQYTRDVVLLFSGTVGETLVGSCVSMNNITEMVALAKRRARATTELIDASVDIPAGCHKTISLCIAASVVDMVFGDGGKEKSMAVRNAALMMSTEWGIFESVNRRYEDIHRLVEKFSC